jgi:F-type H+-transporting ATPase subunit b
VRFASALALASVLATDLALAATGGGESVGEEVGVEPHASGGMPQLDPTYFPSQIFWLVVAFALLYWLLAKRGIPRVADILETRQDRIAADLDRAQTLRREAETAMAEHERRVAEAQAKARAHLDAANERVRADAARQEAELDKALQEKLAAAESRIAQARDEALHALEDVARDVSRDAVGRLIGVDVSESEAAAAVADVRRKAA